MKNLYMNNQEVSVVFTKFDIYVFFILEVVNVEIMQYVLIVNISQ